MALNVFFILHFPPPVHGAAVMGEYIKESKRVNLAFNCSYINLSTSKALSEIGEVGIKKLMSYVALVWQIVRTAAREKPDICYVTPSARKLGFYKDFPIVMLLKLMGKRVVIHYHNKGISGWSKGWVDRLFCKLFYKDLKVILLAEELYPDVERFVKRSDVEICPNGIPISKEKVARKKTEGQLFNMLFLSNMMKEKGVWDLLHACDILKNRGAKFNCHFIGKWSDITEEAFATSVKYYQLQDCVVAHGGVYGEDKRKFFEQADCFVVPSHKECFPLVLLEAMEYALPCISTQEGGIAVIIEEGKTGYLVEKQEPVKLADAIWKVMCRPHQSEQMGQAGREKLERQFTLNMFEERIIEILQQQGEKR